MSNCQNIAEHDDIHENEIRIAWLNMTCKKTLLKQSKCMGNCEEELPKNLSADSLLTANQQVTDRLRKKKNCVKNEQLTWHNNP